ncbi:hypothetical protein [uncultured Cloacibacillus sp.]
MDNTKQGRLLEIFFRSLRGEDVCIKKLAKEAAARDIRKLSL